MKGIKRALARGRTVVYGTVLFISLMMATSASAFNFDVSSDIKGSWDNTIKFSGGYRVEKASDDLTSDPQGDDGDRNFARTWTSLRLDLLSELDIKYKDTVGVRVSGSGWYDPIYYNRETSNDSPGTYNSVSAASNKDFPKDTRDFLGLNADLLDAYIWTRQDIGETKLTLRAGRHTLMWGESLFNATNGIAYGNAPIDGIKLLSVPGSQAKELFMPVNQISTQYQLLQGLSLAAFYQLEWRRSRAPAAGSYVSDLDLIDIGGERLIGPNWMRAQDDLLASESGQYGLSARFRVEALDTDFGIYYLKYHSKDPQLYVYPVVGAYKEVFAENIEALGVSFGTQIGPVNVSGETHMRFNMPLQSGAQAVLPGITADNDDNPIYATGDTWHGNLSATYCLGPNFIAPSAMLLAEVFADHVVRYAKNEAAVDPARYRSAWGFRMVYDPTYTQVLSGLDISIPVGLGYNPRGLSSVTAKFNSGADEGGDWSVGVNFTYQQVWKANVTYTNYFGSAGTQKLADRDFVSFSIQRTF